MQDDVLEKVTKQIIFNDAGLVPVIAQQYNTGEVLMMAWMNKDAIKETLVSQRACYWSRSRQEMWRKGDTSGHTQRVKDLRLDCDGDSILLLVEQTGPACHTNRPNCFYKRINDKGIEILTQPVT